MWPLILLASCGPGMGEISPPPGVVPPRPTLFVIAAHGGVAIEDSSGKAIPFTSTSPQAGIDTLVVEAAEGTEFFVQLTPSHVTRSRLGPWKVKAMAAPPKSAPVIEPQDEFHEDGCPSAWGTTLSSSIEAPAYEYEFTPGHGKTIRAFDHRLLVGHTGCDRSTWDWADGQVDVRLRPLFSDGSVGVWSNTLSLDVPRTPIARRVRRALAEVAADYSAVGVLLGMPLAVSIALALFITRRV